MAEPIDEVEIERAVTVAIYRHAKGDIDALARNIIGDLRRAGFETRRTNITRCRPGGILAANTNSGPRLEQSGGVLLINSTPSVIKI
jgi:hypothetical protein